MGESAENVLRAFGTARTKGILVPAKDDRVTLTRHDAPEDLADVVERFWIVRWDLTGSPPVEQEVLPFPCVNLVFGDHRPGVHGPINSRFVAHLAHAGCVVGIKFKASGFRALLKKNLEPTALVDRPFKAEEVLAAKAEVTALDAQLAEADTDDAKLELVTRFVRENHPGADDEDRELNTVVDISRLDPTLTRVAWLAEHAGRPVRSLERLFKSRIGVSPKWVIRRFRVQEAAVRMAKGLTIDLAALALILGYYDQSHFIHDFRAQIGRTPGQYIAHCATVRASA